MRISKKDLGAVLIFVALVAAIVLLVNGVSNKSNERELRIVKDAVKNAALTCYAVEGMYPEDVQYLRDHYNLSFNQDKYVVEYIWIASNVIPRIKVVERGNMDL